ncbi:phage portal protein [Parabacteroides sp. OttesenSCG-928-B22]|nr:phage portal protein [Parabacteroides sp. OttesenSCG-928-B22]
MAKEIETREQVREIEAVIAELKNKSVELPSWEGELKNEYYPKLHPVMDTKTYKDKAGKNGVVKVTRATRGLQRRAVKTMTGMMFGIPVERIYTQTNPKSKEEEKAAAILEKIFERNRIDTVNIDRGIKLFASCEIATLWYAIKADNVLYGEKCKLKLKCRTFSPMSGESIYPLMDEYGDMVALSFEYQRKEYGKTVTYFDSYTATEHFKYRQADGKWEEVEKEDITLIGKIPGAYGTRATPIWEDSNNVTEIEWAYSRNGNYLRRNSVPIYEVCDDEDIEFGKEKDDDERLVLHLSSKGSSGYKTWPQAVESLKFHTEGLERGFFSDIQLPNFSSDEMKSMPASGESKRYMFMDAHIKVKEEQGMWLELFDREINVVRAFAKIMFPSLATAFDAIQVKCIITPFSMTDEKDTISNGTSATGGKAIASRKTVIKRLGWADDVEEEMAEIEKDEMTGFTEPTY